EFKGNTDQSSIVRHRLKRHLYTAKVLLYLTSYFGRMCMSVEIYGCRTGDIFVLTLFSSKQRQREEPIRCNLTKQPGNCKASFPRWFLTRKLNNVNRLVMVDAMEISMTVGKYVEVNDMPGW
ncbi:unnamed protein product, partial [Pocillopora meandrina]